MARPTNASITSVYLLVAAILGATTWFMIAPEFADDARVSRALRVSAQLAFLTYALIFIARPMRQLMPNRLTQTILSKRPYLGVSLAAIMSVHLVLIAWRFAFVIHERPPLQTLLLGGTAYVLIFLMLITTYAAPARALGPRNWRRLHKTGVYFIGAIYLNALVRDVFAKPSDPVYLVIGILIALVIAVRVAAFAKQKYQSTAAIASDK